MQVKSELRKQILLLRNSFGEEKRQECSQKIAQRLYGLAEYKDCSEIFCYFSKKNEISTEDIIRKALREGKKTALPVCIGDEMIFRYIGGFEDLEKGSFGVYEPKSRCPQAIAEKSTVCIVPGLCYNGNGYRIGYGKGFYDKFLAKNPCIKIGLCYEEFIIDFVPQKNDIPTDIIVSENKVITIRDSRQNRKEEQNG